MHILLGFSESTQKQDFHLHKAKEAEKQIHDMGKEQADLIFLKDNQQSGWHV